MRKRLAIALIAGTLVVTWGQASFGSVGPARAATASQRCSPARTHAAGLSTESIGTAGGDRSYLLYVPPRYNGTRRVPVVFDFHTITSSAADQLNQFGPQADFRPLADREGFLLIAPEGQGNLHHWNVPPYIPDKDGVYSPAPGETDDVAFSLKLLDRLEKDLCVNERRVYATGFSTGAAMAALLACRASDRFAAVGAVAWVVYRFEPACAPRRPVAIAAFSGAADPFVPFNGGPVLVGHAVTDPAPKAIADYAHRDGCAPRPTDKRLAAMVLLHRYHGCKPGTAVDFYVIEGGGHAWPGGRELPGYGTTTQEINATQTLWAFFASHQLGR